MCRPFVLRVESRISHTNQRAKRGTFSQPNLLILLSTLFVFLMNYLAKPIPPLNAMTQILSGSFKKGHHDKNSIIIKRDFFFSFYCLYFLIYVNN